MLLGKHPSLVFASLYPQSPTRWWPAHPPSAIRQPRNFPQTAPCNFKICAMLTRLKGYLVISPSRPNSRPPSPVECGGMTPLWNWETCLPVDRTPDHNQTKSNHPASPSRLPFEFRGYPHPISKIRNPCPLPLPIKAKTPAIKANQASSRQTPNFRSAPVPGRSHVQSLQPAPSYLQTAPAPIKAKTPAIKAHQASSRQTLKNSNPTIPSANGAAPYQPRATRPGFGPRMTLALKGRPIPLTSPIKAKTPLIVHHQASSRQTMKYNDAIMPSARQRGTARLRIGRAGAAAPPHLNEAVSPVTQSTDSQRTSLCRRRQSRQNPQQSRLIKPHQGKR